MWQNVKYYVLAYTVMVAGALLSSGFQLLGDRFPVGHPISTVAASLSGVTIGGLIMVLGFIRDSRVEEERKRTAEERKRAEAAEARAAAAEARVQEERERIDRVIERYEAITESLIKRLGGRNGNGATD